MKIANFKNLIGFATNMIKIIVFVLGFCDARGLQTCICVRSRGLGPYETNLFFCYFHCKTKACRPAGWRPAKVCRLARSEKKESMKIMNFKNLVGFTMKMLKIIVP